jgi:hypothetical protein
MSSLGRLSDPSAYVVCFEHWNYESKMRSWTRQWAVVPRNKHYARPQPNKPYQDFTIDAMHAPGELLALKPAISLNAPLQTSPGRVP